MRIVSVTRGKSLGRLFHLCRELIGQPKLRQNRVHLHLVLPLLAQDLNHAPDGLVTGVVPLFQGHQDLVTFCGAAQVAGGNEKVGVDPLVGGLSKAVVAHERHGHDVVLAEALRDALDARRGAPAPLQPLHFHGVAPKGISRLGLGHPNLVAIGHPHKTCAHAGDLDGALRAGLLLNFRSGQHVATATEVFELALLRQFFHQSHHRPTHVVVQNAQRA